MDIQNIIALEEGVQNLREEISDVKEEIHHLQNDVARFDRVIHAHLLEHRAGINRLNLQMETAFKRIDVDFGYFNDYLRHIKKEIAEEKEGRRLHEEAMWLKFLLLRNVSTSVKLLTIFKIFVIFLRI